MRAFEEAHIYAIPVCMKAAATCAGCCRVCLQLGASASLHVLCPPHRAWTVHEHFEAAGYQVREWQQVTTRGRRRPLRFNGSATLAAFVTSISDIDDLVYIPTAFQIESGTSCTICLHTVHCPASPAAAKELIVPIRLR